ncbi:hypothetical protein [Emticicia sp. 17c]|uniref:hypothetical protein n=1 Tax=Emticicia sp. 17c TaxID=3127704 RepID=UPI00301DE5FF
MEDVTQYIKKYWFGFAFMLLGFTLIILASTVFSNNTETQPLPTTEQSNISAEIHELHKQIEALQEQNVQLVERLQKIDSLRLENARNTLNQSVREHYGEITKRYANDPRIK